MQPLPASDHPLFVHKMSLLDRLKSGGIPCWAILILALLLFALFVTLLVGRRNLSSIVAYFAASFLPLMVALVAVGQNMLSVFENLGTQGIADPGLIPHLLQEASFTLTFGAGVSVLGLLGAVILALIGPSKALTPPPLAQ